MWTRSRQLAYLAMRRHRARAEGVCIICLRRPARPRMAACFPCALAASNRRRAAGARHSHTEAPDATEETSAMFVAVKPHLQATLTGKGRELSATEAKRRSVMAVARRVARLEQRRRLLRRQLSETRRELKFARVEFKALTQEPEIVLSSSDPATPTKVN